MSHKSPIPIACALLAALPTLAHAQAPEAEPSYVDGIVGVVENESITRHELEQACRLVREYRDYPPGSAQRQELLERQLDVIIEERLLLRRAAEVGVELTESDQQRIEWELEQAAAENGGTDGLRLGLEEIGVTFEYFVKRKQVNTLIRKLLLQEISRDIFPPPGEVRRYYEEHPHEFEHPGETRIRQIVVYEDLELAYREPPAVADWLGRGEWDARAFATAIRERVVSGEPFDAVATEASMQAADDVKEDTFMSSTPLEQVLVAPLPEAVRALRVGEISDVIDSGRGTLHIILLTERIQSGRRTFLEVQQEIEGLIKEQIWQRRLRVWIDEVKENAFTQRFLEGGNKASRPERASSASLRRR
ncbi:peptidyl-prolyl cis-trans isomerase [Planctomycetota bacterium]|nr:peptidyl-prolyl cis-trans isomerase [Planctomycetota bacterium]